MAPWRRSSPPRTGHRPKSDHHLRGWGGCGGKRVGRGGGGAWFLCWFDPGGSKREADEAGRAGCAGAERSNWMRGRRGCSEIEGPERVAGVPKGSWAYRYPGVILRGGRVRACWCTRATRVRGARLRDTPRVSGGRRAIGRSRQRSARGVRARPAEPRKTGTAVRHREWANQGHQQSRDTGCVVDRQDGRAERARRLPDIHGQGQQPWGGRQHTEDEALEGRRRQRRMREAEVER
ncbi:hypothetical protein H4W79_001867 [Nocardiopsis terrae]|uniref:Uncharacterized protein n=1 Tax=Nocardiopsis terrae TaxID=372655 RepID=A0ABR9HF54_9ACTN|nr:hypothetical protein [Nocardiopsis terrae]